MHTFKTSQAKENILRKIRAGLAKGSLPMPFPDVEKTDAALVFMAPDSLAETFAKQFIQLGGKFVFCADEQEFFENIRLLYDSLGWSQLLCADEILLKRMQNQGLDFIQSADAQLKDADACITGCECLIARTGSAIFSSRQHLGRIASIFYPVHIIVAYAGQILPDIKDGLELITHKYAPNIPSMLNLNTGPSRTADIEKTLVVGVHGPKEVFCFWVDA
jgi:L-lactate dehydrogenase complex protein LldG